MDHPSRERGAPKRLTDEQAAEHEATKARKKTKEKKAPVNTKAFRSRKLQKALTVVGLVRRSDSRLCDAYVDGTTDKSAVEVATIMCRMKYIYEGCCPQFNRKWEELEQQVEYVVEELAKRELKFHYAENFGGRNDYEGYYTGITWDACFEVSDSSAYSLGEMRTQLVNGWTEFPSTWPWLHDGV
jgi:hypothetical protein